MPIARSLLVACACGLVWGTAATCHAQPRPGQPGPMRLPDSVRLEADLPYADNDNPRQRLDLLLPKHPADDKPLPVVAFIHGWAWRAGDKRGGLNQVARLVASGQFAGASIGYRLTDEAIWPAQIHDCKAAIRWLRAHAKQYHLDADKIAVWGSSAGGHLVAMLGTSGDVKELEGKLGKYLDQSSRVTCVVDFFGPTDLLAMGKFPSRIAHDAADSPESRLVGGPLQEKAEAAKSASPITYVTKDDPPFLIMHGSEDPLVPFNQSERLRDALQKVGGTPLLVKVQGAGHGFGGPEVARRVEQFLQKHLRGQDVKVSDEPITP